MYKIIFSRDKEWSYYIEKLPIDKQDIYFTNKYYQIYENKGDGVAALFVFEKHNDLGIYPFLINEITGYQLDKKYYDIQTAYGYGGPLTTTMEPDFIKSFESEFLNYANEHNIVAEFIRYHPILANYNIFSKNVKILENRVTVFLNLDDTLENISAKEISARGRRYIRIAQRNHLSVNFNDNYDAFIELYNETMQKVNASNYYYFSKDYFDAIKKSDFAKVISILLDGKVISVAIFILFGNYFHYHLAGSSKEHLVYHPNDLLIWEAIKYAHKHKYKFFHLGGGRTNEDDDSLFIFKSKFSTNKSKFYIGKRIINENIYKYLIDSWEYNNKRQANLFLEYRTVFDTGNPFNIN